MPTFRWPDDHPNARIMHFVESSRLVLARAGGSPIAASTSTLLDRIQALIDRMATGRSAAELEQLVAQVGPLVNEAVARMQDVGAKGDGGR